MARMISNTRKFVNRMLRAHVVGLTVQSVLNVGAIPGHKDMEEIMLELSPKDTAQVYCALFRGE